MHMKINEGYELRQVGDEYVVITVGDAAEKFNGMIKLNPSGAFIWNRIKEGIDPEQLVDAVAAEYGVERDIAKKDVDLFLDSLKTTGCFSE